MKREQHLLIILGEECNEVAQRVSKALRFGLQEIQPGQELTNSERITKEYADLIGVIEMLYKDGVIGRPMLFDIEAKKKKVEKYLLLSSDCGTLDS